MHELVPLPLFNHPDYFLIGLRDPLTGTCVGLALLTAHWQTTTMTQTAIATKIHQALDAHADFTAQDHLQRQFGNFVTQRVDLSFTAY